MDYKNCTAFLLCDTANEVVVLLDRGLIRSPLAIVVTFKTTSQPTIKQVFCCNKSLLVSLCLRDYIKYLRDAVMIYAI